MSLLRSRGSYPSGQSNAKWPAEESRPRGSVVAETERLCLRELTADDASFILELLNDPSFIRYIGDKGARTLEDARQYIADGPRASYSRNGFGLYLVQIRDTGQRIGMCGLVKREVLNDVDIGFAFLPAFWSRGYALEASREVMRLATTVFGIRRVVAITSTDNHSSMSLLSKIGLRFEGTVCLPGHGEVVNLFVPKTGTDLQGTNKTCSPVPGYR